MAAHPLSDVLSGQGIEGIAKHRPLCMIQSLLHRYTFANTMPIQKCPTFSQQLLDDLDIARCHGHTQVVLKDKVTQLPSGLRVGRIRLFDHDRGRAGPRRLQAPQPRELGNARLADDRAKAIDGQSDRTILGLNTN